MSSMAAVAPPSMDSAAPVNKPPLMGWKARPELPGGHPNRQPAILRVACGRDGNADVWRGHVGAGEGQSRSQHGPHIKGCKTRGGGRDAGHILVQQRERSAAPAVIEAAAGGEKFPQRGATVAARRMSMDRSATCFVIVYLIRVTYSTFFAMYGRSNLTLRPFRGDQDSR